ncbi:hypothetical protein [Kingella oralis]
MQATPTLRAARNRTWRIAAIPTLSIAVAQTFQAAFEYCKGSLKTKTVWYRAKRFFAG